MCRETGFIWGRAGFVADEVQQGRDHQREKEWHRGGECERGKKALGYGRVSTIKQVVDGASLEAQRVEITSFAIACGLDLLDVICDDGISGSKAEDERPALAELLQAVRDRKIATVIVCKKDRLARDQALAGHIETIIRRAGIDLIAIDEVGLNPITKAVLTMVAEVERMLAAQRTRFAMRALKLKGRRFGTVPFGYRRTGDGAFEADPEEYRVVQEVVRLRASGMTLAGIAVELATRGVRTRRSGRWSPEQVRSILLRARADETAGGPLREAVYSAPPSARS